MFCLHEHICTKFVAGWYLLTSECAISPRAEQSILKVWGGETGGLSTESSHCSEPDRLTLPRVSRSLPRARPFLHACPLTPPTHLLRRHPSTRGISGLPIARSPWWWCGAVGAEGASRPAGCRLFASFALSRKCCVSPQGRSGSCASSGQSGERVGTVPRPRAARVDARAWVQGRGRQHAGRRR